MEAATDCGSKVNETPVGLAPTQVTTSPLPSQTSKGADQPLATEPVGLAEAWCGLEADPILDLAAETSPGNQHLTSEEAQANPASSQQSVLCQDVVDPVATCDVAEHFHNTTQGFYRELEETRDVRLPLPDDEKQLENSQASRLGNFAVGDVVLANGRLGVVFWDGRPRHDYAMLVWKDDGTESGVRASEVAKVACDPDLAGRSDALSFRCLSNRIAALDLHNQRLRGWQVGATS